MVPWAGTAAQPAPATSFIFLPFFFSNKKKLFFKVFNLFKFLDFFKINSFLLIFLF
jgi:hypothetical protein